MCYRPVKIRNTRTFKRFGIDRDFLFVPCGHCAQCRQRKIDDWFVRLSYEADSYRANGGCVLFVTCTFNDYNVPKFDSSKVDCLKSFYPSNIDLSYYDGNYTFGKHEVRQFLKDLRQILVKNGYKAGLKYFCVSELGTDERYTHRPHYHFVFFMPCKVSAVKFLSWCNLAWSHKIKIFDYPQLVVNDIELERQFSKGYDYYINDKVIVKEKQGCAKHQYFLRNGYCNYSKDRVTHELRPYLTNNLGLRYLLKYLYKDDLFMSNSFARDVSEVIKFVPALDKLTEEEVDALHYLKDILPFHLQSTNLGKSLVDLFKQSGDYTAIIMNDKISVKDDINTYYVPLYIVRKLCYNEEIEPSLVPYRDSAKVCKLNDIGYKVLLEQYDYKIKDKIESYNYILSSAFVSKFNKLDSSLVSQYNISHLRDIVSKNAELLAVYDIVFRGIYINIDKNVYTFSNEKLMQLARCMFDVKLYTQPIYDILDIRYIKDDNLSMFNLFRDFDNSVGLFFDDLPQFRDFNEVLDSLTKIRNIVYENEYRIKEEEYKKKVLTKKVHSSLIYNKVS